jgi:hypothetical protein
LTPSSRTCRRTRRPKRHLSGHASPKLLQTRVKRRPSSRRSPRSPRSGNWTCWAT